MNGNIFCRSIVYYELVIKMKTQFTISIFIALCAFTFLSCQQGNKAKISEIIGEEEYTRLMALSLDGFDQSAEGFRQYSDNYELMCLLIPEYIVVNELPASHSRNLHWHLGQIHAFNDNYEAAITEMKQAFEGGSLTWACYINGSIAFLEKDKAALQEALETLQKQDNQMNIEILEKFVKYFDRSYAEAYTAEY